MTAPYTAQCACGAISATIKGEPLGVRLCWCRQCQQIAAGGATTNAVFRTADIALAGALASHGFTAASGNTLTQFFCPSCGTPVYGQSSARLHLASIRLGFLDVGHGLKPDTTIWTEEAPDWAMIDPALQRFERQPPPPPQA
jgi:hypothetical protein